MSRQILIDQYGRPSTHPFSKDASNPLAAYQVDDATEGVTYVRFQADDECVIQKIATADSITTVTVGFGAWTNRASLVYQQVNEPLAIDASKLSTIFARV